MSSWFIVALILWVTAWSAFGIFRSTDSRGKLLLDAGLTVAIVFLLAHAITVQWAVVVPIWLWWVTAALLGVHLAGLTYRVLGGARMARSSSTPQAEG